MTNLNKKVAFLQKLSELTKEKRLSWEPYSSFCHKLKPSSSLGENNASSTVLIRKDYLSYACNFKCNQIFLIIYEGYAENSISLYIQTDTSELSNKFASTAEEIVDIATNLKRLYNLIDKTNPDIDSFVDEILNL